MPKQITARVTLDGGTLLSTANAHRIIARDTRPSDRSGNRLREGEKSPIERYKNDPPYFQRWTVKKEPEGFIFREVTHNGGLCGHADNVRQLVIKTLCGLCGEHIIVEVED